MYKKKNGPTERTQKHLVFLRGSLLPATFIAWYLKHAQRTLPLGPRKSDPSRANSLEKGPISEEWRLS